MKIIVFILIILINLININHSFVYSKSEYARAINPVYLYNTSNNNENSNIKCIIEKSYFVEIISEINDYYKVNYNGTTGFVKKNDVKVTTSIPSTPYPYNIKIEIENDCNLRSSPTTKSSINNVLATLKSGETNIQFIGRIFSEEAIDFGGTTWYYVNFQGQYGYIYTKYVQSLPPTHAHTEVVNFKSENITDLTNPITHTSNIILIIILFIPCLLILLILYYPRKRNKKSKSHKTPKLNEKY